MSSAGSFANCSVAAVKGQELCQRKLLRLLATISSNERNKEQTFKSSEFVLVKHPLLKTGRKSYSILFYLFYYGCFVLFFVFFCGFLLLVGFVFFLRFLKEADTRGTSGIIYIRLKKEKVVREWGREREREREREAKIIGFSQNYKLIVKLATFLGAVFHSCISTDTSRQIQFFYVQKS